MRSNLVSVATFIIISLSSPQSIYAGDKVSEIKIPPTLLKGIDYLTAYLKEDKDIPFDVEAASEILTFILKTKRSDSLYYAEKWRDATSAYFEFEINTDMDSLLKYTFNPAIPSHLFKPSSLRFSHWKGDERKGELWEIMNNLDRPYAIRGIEQEETTPDTNTGAYYEYDMNRAIILCKYKGKRFVISISEQKGQSSVGRKGIALGSDEDWNYFYSGERGLNKTGLGWVKSYLYSSLSITVFCEPARDKPMIRAGTFKWLNAGWSGINMVKRSHIINGTRRYARDIKSILENPALPSPENLTKEFDLIKNLTEKELKTRASRYTELLQKEYGENSVLSKRKFRKMIEDGSYLKKMDRTRMEALVTKNRMKELLGKGFKGTLYWEKP